MTDQDPSPETDGEPGRDGEPSGDLRSLLRQLAQPVVDSIDARLREQVDRRVDERVDERVARALEARLSVIERALADLDRAVRALEDRLGPT